ncbi:cytochrome c biogenesis CcdA family protein [Shewanella marina]|uniref:cytochrome c biogenesis CcdA family protein n=1 Tax=Shewanella marina TaxID=487319 RepID=UPI000A4CEDCE|nr:cytochrome c biogenesis protein CcdA [Shewanella marina]
MIPQLNDKLSFMLSRLTSNAASQQWQGDSVAMQLVIGASLGLVWLPCVGPTLGTAIALASTGQSIPLAFIVMLTFGFGTALPLIIIGYMSAKQFSKIGNIAAKSKYILGITLILLGLAILTGIDRELEKLALSILPDFITEI